MPRVEMTKKELVDDLLGQDGEDPEGDHNRAESMILEYINDEEITEAWLKASSHWWYA